MRIWSNLDYKTSYTLIHTSYPSRVASKVI
nr:MAG TPA: hypothetical protein [Caudoviricetes sp.]